MAKSIVYGNDKPGQPSRKRNAAPATKRARPAPNSLNKRTLLKFRPDAKGLDRLPFVAEHWGAGITPYWHVPATGGKLGGFKTGAAMATAYMKSRRGQEPSRDYHDLINTVNSFMRRFEEESGRDVLTRTEESGSFRSLSGQFTGFLCILSGWLDRAAKELGCGLDEKTDG